MSKPKPITLDVRQDAEAILRLLDKMRTAGDGYKRTSEWFERLIDAGYTSLVEGSQGNLCWQPDWADAEPRAYELMTEAFAVLLAHGLNRTYQDVIGSVYMEVATGSDARHMGQFFTPFDVAKAMAQMTIGDVDRILYTPERPMTVMDPACGSGVMLLACASILPRDMVENGEVAFYGIDLDPLCVAMCRLNMRLYGLGGKRAEADFRTVDIADAQLPLFGEETAA